MSSFSYNLWVTLRQRCFFHTQHPASLENFAFHWPACLLITEHVHWYFATSCRPPFKEHCCTDNLGGGKWIHSIPETGLLLGEYLLVLPEIQCYRVLEDACLTRKCSQSNFNRLLCIPGQSASPESLKR